MVKNYIRLNDNGFCCEYTISNLNPGENWLEIPRELYPSNTGQRFDTQKMKWLDEFDDNLISPEVIIPLSEHEQMELDNYTNLLYLTALADLGM